MRSIQFIGTGALMAWLAASQSFGQVTDPTIWWYTNGPPLVHIISPQEGESILTGGIIHICAVSLNFTDAVSRVEFLANNESLGTVTNTPTPWMPMGDRFACMTWSNAAAGAYTLKAIATDLAGISVTSAPVSINVVTNLPPLVRLVKPQDGAAILGPTNINVCASAFDPDGTVAQVAFYEGANLVGVVTSTPPAFVTNSYGVFPIRQTSYCLTWSNAAPGSYALTAVATDNEGAMAASDAVDITVVTNLPPVVAILRPQNGARFLAPATLRLSAVATDGDDSVAKLEFFSGKQSLGVLTSGMSVTNYGGQVLTYYSLTWSNVPAGSYTLTAVATDSVGVSSTSKPVTLTVAPPPAPSVQIVYPNNGARFFAPATIPISAVARNFTNQIASIQFLSGTQTLGTKTNSWWSTFLWKNVPQGNYTLSAIATDTTGLSATSAPVSISVVTNSWRWRMMDE